MDRLAHDALVALDAFLQSYGCSAPEDWPASPAGCSPIDVVVARAGFHDVRVQFGQLRFVHSHGVHTHWTMPMSLQHFDTDFLAGKYPELVADGPF